MSDDETLRVYDAKAEEYAGLGKTSGENRSLQRFLEAMVPGGRVLDLGCGPGTWARGMAEAGLQVEAWDASDGMIALASEIPGVAARRALFQDLTAEAAYDGIWANFSLLHAPHSEFPGHLARIARALRPGGLAHFGLKEGDGERRDGLGRFYSYHQVDGFSAQLRAVGLEPGAFRKGEGKGLDGEMAPWFTVLAVKGLE